jgi:hypothetical protein
MFETLGSMSTNFEMDVKSFKKLKIVEKEKIMNM